MNDQFENHQELEKSTDQEFNPCDYAEVENGKCMGAWIPFRNGNEYDETIYSKCHNCEEYIHFKPKEPKQQVAENNKKTCILTQSSKAGARIFYFDHPETDDAEFNQNYVRVYYDIKEKEPFLRCHVSKVIEVPDTETASIWGGLYASSTFFQSVMDKWKD